MQNENLQNIELVSKGGYAIPFGPESDLLGGFFKKSLDSNFNSSLVCKNVMSVLPEIDSHNLLRRCCLAVSTESLVIDVPSSSQVVVSTSCTSSSGGGEVVRIELSEAFAKWQIPRNIFYQLPNYNEYLMSILHARVAQLELELLMKPNVLEQKLSSSWFRSSTDASKPHLKDNSKVTNFDTLLELFNSLPPRYRYNAKWMMSSNSLSKFIKLFSDKKDIYLEGVIALLGKPVEVVEELGDLILFADFKQAMVLAERLNPKMEMHSGFDNPSLVGLSLPISVGLGVVNPDAIKAGIVKDEDKDTDVQR